MTVTAPQLSPKRSPKRKQRKVLPPTLGPQVCRWIERKLVHADGDYLGQPFRLRRFQRELIYRAYEVTDGGDRLHRRVVWGLPSGNGKTELAAALACAELDGPVSCKGFNAAGHPIGARRVSPDIPVAAASFEQADLLFGAARLMLGQGPIADRFDIYDTAIGLRDRPGRIYRVAAKAGTNDGRRPSFFVADEVHEWDCTCYAPGGVHQGSCKARVHTVLSKGRAKRRGAWELNISTAGHDLQSLLGGLYRHGQDVAAGRMDDPEFLFEWFQPVADEVDLNDPSALERAIRDSNPAVDDFLPMANLLAAAQAMPSFVFRRYHLNQWTKAPDAWLPDGLWASRRHATRHIPDDGTPIVLGFDGSFSGDSTALVGATIEEVPHLFVVDAWEQDPADRDWRVDILDVEQAIRNACGRWSVRLIGCDPYRWQRSLAVLIDEGLPVLEWPTHLPSRMVPACAQFYDAVGDGRLTHDGDERLERHMGNCVVKRDSRGPRIVKEHRNSARRIDLAVCAIVAHDLAVRALNEANIGDAWRPI